MRWYLGLTGSIGTGKSTTAKMFREAGVPVWDADATVHHLYATDQTLITEIANAFPDAVKNGQVSRQTLAKILAAEPEKLKVLEQIVHPYVARDRQKFIAEHADSLLLFDIPLLFETGAEAWLDSVLVVTCSPEEQRARVLARPGMTEEKFAFILSRQIPDDEKRARADHVIVTDTLADTESRVLALIAELKEKAKDA